MYSVNYKYAEKQQTHRIVIVSIYVYSPRPINTSERFLFLTTASTPSNIFSVSESAWVVSKTVFLTISSSLPLEEYSDSIARKTETTLSMPSESKCCNASSRINKLDCTFNRRAETSAYANARPMANLRRSPPESCRNERSYCSPECCLRANMILSIFSKRGADIGRRR